MGGEERGRAGPPGDLGWAGGGWGGALVLNLVMIRRGEVREEVTANLPFSFPQTNPVSLGFLVNLGRGLRSKDGGWPVSRHTVPTPFFFPLRLDDV